jgi:hypothetical protein
MYNKIKIFLRKFTEAFTACGMVMVQGNLSVFELRHFILAGKVGFLTGLAFIVTSFFKTKNKLLPIYLTGVFVTIADFLVHTSMIINDFVEPLITGSCAMIIAYLYEKFNNKKK